MNIERKGNSIVITVDVAEATVKAARPSSTGKTLIIDTTGTAQAVGDFKVQATVYVKNPAFTAAPKAK